MKMEVVLMNTLDKTKIYLDEEGKEELLGRIDSLREELNKVARENVEGESAQSTASYSEVPIRVGELGKEATIKAEIKHALDLLSRSVPIEKHGIEGKVDIYDEVKVSPIHSGDSEHSYMLVARNSKNPNEISINSTLGRAIYMAQAGEKIGYDTSLRGVVTHTDIEVLNIERQNIHKSLN
jgi:transcription elongation GreA/GreB family factor